VIGCIAIGDDEHSVSVQVKPCGPTSSALGRGARFILALDELPADDRAGSSENLNVKRIPAWAGVGVTAGGRNRQEHDGQQGHAPHRLGPAARITRPCNDVLSSVFLVIGNLNRLFVRCFNNSLPFSSVDISKNSYAYSFFFYPFALSAIRCGGNTGYRSVCKCFFNISRMLRYP